MHENEPDTSIPSWYALCAGKSAHSNLCDLLNYLPNGEMEKIKRMKITRQTRHHLNAIRLPVSEREVSLSCRNDLSSAVLLVNMAERAFFSRIHRSLFVNVLQGGTFASIGKAFFVSALHHFWDERLVSARVYVTCASRLDGKLINANSSH